MRFHIFTLPSLFLILSTTQSAPLLGLSKYLANLVSDFNDSNEYQSSNDLSLSKQQAFQSIIDLVDIPTHDESRPIHLLYPKLPKQLQIDIVHILVFHAVTDRKKESFSVYLSLEPEFEDEGTLLVREFGKFNVHDGVSDYMLYFKPLKTDLIAEEIDPNQKYSFSVVKKTWFGLFKKIIYSSPPFQFVDNEKSTTVENQ